MKTVANRIPNPRDLIVWWIVPAGFVSAAALFPLADPDMWWHLAAGRMILDGQFPATNLFSHTFPDHPWRFTQWLFGTLIALAESVGGFPAVQLVACAFAAGTFLLVIATIRRDDARARWFLVLPLIAVGVLSVRFRFVPRGDLATLLGLAAIHHLWVVRPKRLPLYLLPLGCLWSNLHAGVVFGVLAIGLFGGAAVLDRDRKSIRDALIGGSAFFAGSLANPFFHYPYVYVLENLEIARHFPMPIQELLPPDWGHPRFALPAALALLGLVPALVRRRYRDVLLIAGSGAMAVGAVRFLPFLAILGLPGVAKSFEDYREFLGARRGSNAGAALVAVPLAAVALFLGYVVRKEVPPGVGANLRMYPAGSAEFILSRGFTGRMFNEFDQGGFLAWRLFPRQRVFIDSRGNAYPWNHFGSIAGITRGTLAGLLDRYGVDSAVVQRRPFGGKVDWGPAFAAMGWNLVHVEGAAFLFVRPGSPDATRARADVFRFYVPGGNPETLVRSAGENPARAHSELVRIDPRSVIEAEESNFLGICAQLTGDAALASRFLEAGLESFPEHLPLRFSYALVLESSGRIREAAEQHRRILAEDASSEIAARASRRLEAIGKMRSGDAGTAR